MDIYVSNVPSQCSDNQLRDCFKKPLANFGIHTFNCKKPKGKNFGFITVLDLKAGTAFVDQHGVSPRDRAQLQPLKLHGSILTCRSGNQKPQPLTIGCLIKEDEDRKYKRIRKTSITQVATSSAPQLHSFRVATLHSGYWDYLRENLTFYPVYADTRHGSIILGRKSLTIVLDRNIGNPRTTRLDVPFDAIDSIFVGNEHQAVVTLNLLQTPSFYDMEVDLESQIEALRFSGTSHQPSPPRITKSRVCSLGPEQTSSSGICLVYRLQLSNPMELHQVSRYLRVTHGAPSCTSWSTTMSQMTDDYDRSMKTLEDQLQAMSSIPWAIRFQLKRLTANAILPSTKVLNLLPYIPALTSAFRESAVVEGIRRLSRELPYPGPQDESTFTTKSIVTAIQRHAGRFTFHGSIYELARRHRQLTLVHRVTVTPAGIYLEGPELETKNRVLRKYSGHPNYFVRVVFTDEDGGSLHTDPGISRQDIFRNKFNATLNGNVKIAGRLYAFLGFSHSNLRAASCWFVAPFVMDGKLVHAKDVIRKLGNFSAIRSPAKCAARIGQTFSDATDTISIKSETIRKIPDVERHGRVFTDGVGTISSDLLHKVWDEFSRTRRANASLLQVRLKGAKGMLVLDTDLIGEKLCLRDSMDKFPVDDAIEYDLEICGAAFRPLPCFLNRQFIKIFEDLGVPDEAFLNLQRKAVERLELMTHSPVNAINFLETHSIATAARVPLLIRLLADLGFNFRKDQFLRQIVEIAASLQLRDIKHRGRIPVEKGHTLYGVADETGALKENQVHVILRDKDGHRSILLGPMIITRAPAMHPGDIRLVEAVAIPPGSSNFHLNNCVIFSQQGERDLPSQLSRGDLDGDLYNIIFDRTLWPKHVSSPADYPRFPAIDIGRQVTTEDMTDFFLRFLETDQLGYISNSHVQAADQLPDGTFSEPCIVLAGMASTAVDYSKTGIPVDMSLFPKGFDRSAKPDFTANAPRLVLSLDQVNLEEDDPLEHEEFDAVRALDPDRRRPRFYKSPKILGQLYRAIDELKFVRDMQSRVSQPGTSGSSQTLLHDVWAYVERNVMYIQWNHLRPRAREIRESYEDALIDTMHHFSPHPRDPLSELEVFAGTILGRLGGVPNKRTRDLAVSMKDKFERDVAFHINWIQHADVADGDGSISGYGAVSEALERSIACLAIAMEEQGRYTRGVGNVKSFAYIAAAVCLQEVSDLASTRFT